MAFCHYHSDRPGVGVCMRCRAVICAACCTRVAGVNHCHACLKAIGLLTVHKAGGRIGTVVGTVSILVGCWLFLFAMFWLWQKLLPP